MLNFSTFHGKAGSVEVQEDILETFSRKKKFNLNRHTGKTASEAKPAGRAEQVKTETSVLGRNALVQIQGKRVDARCIIRRRQATQVSA